MLARNAAARTVASASAGWCAQSSSTAARRTSSTSHPHALWSRGILSSAKPLTAARPRLHTYRTPESFSFSTAVEATSPASSFGQDPVTPALSLQDDASQAEAPNPLPEGAAEHTQVITRLNSTYFEEMFTQPPPLTPAATLSNPADTKVHVKMSFLHPSSKADFFSQPEHSPATSSSNPSEENEAESVRPAAFVPLSSHVFGIQPRRDIVHSAVVYYLDQQRSGTASTKTRGEVAFSGAKLRPQKGTGQARLGTRGNPLLRKGGVIHGPRPRDLSSNLPRRVRELALRSALSAKWNEGRLFVVPDLRWDPPPRTTGPLANLLGVKGWNDALFLSAPRHPLPSPVSLATRGRPSATDPVYTAEQLERHAESVRNFLIASANIPCIDFVELDQRTPEARQRYKSLPNKWLRIKELTNAFKRPGELHAYEVLKRQVVVMDLGAVEWLEEKLGGSAFHEIDEEEVKELVRTMQGWMGWSSADDAKAPEKKAGAEGAPVKPPQRRAPIKRGGSVTVHKDEGVSPPASTTAAGSSPAA